MSFLTQVKFSNVTNLSDARYAAAVGFNYIGFCFDTASENYIAPIKAKEMIDWITGSNIVAEFGNQTFEEIRDISELLHVAVIEVNNRLLPDELSALGKAVIKKIDVNSFSADELRTEIAAYEKVCDAFHLYSSTDQYNEDEMKALCQGYRIIWGLFVSAENVNDVLQQFKPFAINISGGHEEKAGIRDFDDLNELLEIITVEE